VHLVTGATGFVGRALVLELLRRTPLPVVCLVRPDGSSPRQRLRNALLHAATVYGYGRNVTEAITQRCDAVAGDVRVDGCGLSDDPDWRVDQVWHSAASLRYLPRDSGELEDTNVKGTRRVLDLARRLDANAFNHISTAYVAGRAAGLIPADRVYEGEANNLYESSKIRAEAEVVDATDLRTRIFRPSVVIGHSRTLAVSGTYTGLYGLIDRLSAFSRRVGGTAAGRAPSSIRVKANPEGTVNLVPIDLVAEQTIGCALSSSDALVFHMTTTTPLRVGTFFHGVHAELGLCPPQFVDDTQALSPDEEQLARQISFYSAYLRDNKIFDRTTTDLALGVTDAGRFALTEERFRRFCRWYIDIRTPRPQSAAAAASTREIR
jgi:nucleoside-diphosphate-sugar epimerase